MGDGLCPARATRHAQQREVIQSLGDRSGAPPNGRSVNTGIMLANVSQLFERVGAPGRTRTCDPQIHTTSAFAAILADVRGLDFPFTLGDCR